MKHRKSALGFGEMGKARVNALLGTVLAAAAIVGALLVWAPWAGASVITLLHGIGFSKGCNTPTTVGSAYTCTFGVQNSSLIDTAGDTLTFTALSDDVHSPTAGSNILSGNILPSLTIASVVGGASCVDSGLSATTGGAGALGSGTAPIAKCTLPSNSSVTFNPFSWYTTVSTDPNPLTDTGSLTWQDTCSSLAPNCPVGDQTATTASQSVLQTVTPTPTNTPTPTPTNTPTPTPTNTPTPTPTNTPTPTPTNTPTPTPGAQGCTPGFWKNHLSAWVTFSPSQLVSSVFTNTSPFSSLTLQQALSLQGGPGVDGAKQILLRAAVSALLNSTSVAYPLSTAQVISQVDTALGSNNRDTILALATTLDGFNNGTCPF